MCFNFGCSNVKVIKCINDCFELQYNLWNLEQWCRVIGMALDFQKCYVMRSRRCISPIKFDYKLTGCSLSVINETQDWAYISFGTSLGFILRCSVDFNCVQSIRILYFALVRPQLEYALIIWFPKEAKYIRLIKGTQHRFLRYVSFKMGLYMDRYDHIHLLFFYYTLIANKLNLISLETWRRIAALL